jgi:monofunctional biosynthetic peptidoglycan transglycosylase
MKRSLPARIARWVTAAVLGAALLSILAVALLRWLPVPVTAFMAGERAAAAGSSPPLVQQHDWVPWPRISRHAALAVIAAEDQKFMLHDGFDFQQIEKAVTDAQRGKRLRGASTISQQVAKNLFLWPGQSWMRKGLEAWFTVWIEFLWPKRRILEVYLNSAQFGRGVWGVEAASRRYFGKEAAQLTREEAALLAAVLPSPTRYRVVSPGPWVRQRQAWILAQIKRLEAEGTFTLLSDGAW